MIGEIPARRATHTQRMSAIDRRDEAAQLAGSTGLKLLHPLSDIHPHRPTTSQQNSLLSTHTLPQPASSVPSSMPPSPARLREVFAEYDADNSGTISPSELPSALRSLKAPLPPPQRLASILSEHDTDGSGSLSFDEFKAIFDESRLRTVFSSIDVDGSGSIDENELLQAMRKLGLTHLTKAQVKKILVKVDSDKSGDVSYAEFAAFFANIPSPTLEAVAAAWSESTSIDCGSDLAPPITGPGVPWYYAILGGEFEREGSATKHFP
jgi:Ca2+-binding EF-hand superfamily protein